MSRSNKTTTTKERSQRAPAGRADLFHFIYLFILYIEFNYVLTFLKDARERGAHDDCQSPLPGQVGPGLTVQLGRCAIL
jgi:hypothetical protein